MGELVVVVEKLRQRLGQNEEAVGRKEKTMDALRAENLEIKEKLEQIYRFVRECDVTSSWETWSARSRS